MLHRIKELSKIMIHIKINTKLHYSETRRVHWQQPLSSVFPSSFEMLQGSGVVWCGVCFVPGLKNWTKNKVSSSLHDAGRAGPRLVGARCSGLLRFGINIQPLLSHFSLANSSSLQTTIQDEIRCKYSTHTVSLSPSLLTHNIYRPLPLSAFSQLSLLTLKPSPRLRLMPTMVIMDMAWPTMGEIFLNKIFWENCPFRFVWYFV